MKVWHKKIRSPVELMESLFRMDKNGNWIVDVIYDGYRTPSRGVLYTELEPLFHDVPFPEPSLTVKPNQVKKKTVAALNRNKNKKESHPDIIDWTNSSPKSNIKKGGFSLKSSGKKNLRDSLGSDVEIISPLPKFATMARNSGPSNSNDEDGEIVFVGIANEDNRIHARYDCIRFLFSSGKFKETDHGNQHYCGKCYCYACDRPASDCPDWSWHANANQKDPKWQQILSSLRKKPE
jgi:hypothetical protein